MSMLNQLIGNFRALARRLVSNFLPDTTSRPLGFGGSIALMYTGPYPSPRGERNLVRDLGAGAARILSPGENHTGGGTTHFKK